jgi:hypothetical protein
MKPLIILAVKTPMIAPWKFAREMQGAIQIIYYFCLVWKNANTIIHNPVIP